MPIELVHLECIEGISTPKPTMSSLISRLSIRKRARQESFIIEDKSFLDYFKEVLAKEVSSLAASII